WRWKTSGPTDGSWRDCGFRIADCGFAASDVRPDQSAIRNPQSAIATPPAATNARRCIVLAPPRGAVYIMRPRQTLEGAVVDALRSPNRAARRQASQGQLSLGSRDRHSLRRMQGDGEGHEL